MTIQRVTSTSGSRLMVANLQRNYARLTQIQSQIASGKQVQRPSDAPAQVISALDYRAQLRRADQFERNAADAEGWLRTADTALSTAAERMQRVRDLALQGVNGSADATARAAVADEIRQIRESLVELANARYQQRSIFSGTVTGDAYDANAVYLGNAGAVERPVAQAATLQVNLAGTDVFGTATVAPPAVPPPAYGGDLFQVLDQLADDIAAGAPAAATAGLTALDTATTRLQEALAVVGARTNRVEAVRTRNADVTLEVRAALAEVEDIDVPKTLIELQTQQMAYQAALGVTAKVIQPSLLDFLR